MITFKNKDTGEIYTMIGTSCGSRGSYYRLADGKGEMNEIPIEELLLHFEEISSKIDYSSVWPMIQNYIQMNSDVNNMFVAFLRRNDATYYTPGKFVYVTKPCIDPRYYSGPEDNIWFIKEIRIDHFGERKVILQKSELDKSTIEFPASLDRIERYDVYNCVKRLDLPY